MDFLTRIRSRSSIVRAQYALGTAGIITGIIAVIWISTLPARFGDLEGHATSTQRNGVSDDAPQVPAPSATTTRAPELDALRIGETATTSVATSSQGDATTSESVTSSSSVPRVIQIGTTSQNDH